MRKFILSLALCLTTVFALSDDDIYIGEIATWSGFRKGAVSFTFDKGAPEQIAGILYFEAIPNKGDICLYNYSV